VWQRDAVDSGDLRLLFVLDGLDQAKA